RRYDPDSVDVLKGIVGVNMGSKISKNIGIYGSFRLEQVFNDNDISIANWIRGDVTKYKLEKSISDTTFIGDVGVEVEVIKNLKVNIGGRVDLNGDYSAYTGRLRVRYVF
ncbi:MAG: hypothetical protein ACP5K0_05935, partial [Thermosulfidibacteraceae bacterium]